MKVENININLIKPYENNPRINDSAVDKVVMSLEQYGWQQPIVIDKNNIIIVGHTRYKAARKMNLDKVPVLVADNLTDDQVKAYRIADNKTGEIATWDQDLLDIEIKELIDNDFNIEFTGFELDDFNFIDNDISDDNDKIDHININEKFIVPPFSILDTKQGYWVNRKKKWINLIQDNGFSRDCKNISGDREISIFDPVLAEIMIKWFTPYENNNNIYDCFAGGTGIGFVSGYYNNNFIGIELRKEQAEYNDNRTYDCCKYFCDDGININNYIEEESQDLFFTCPPYFNLEIYSDKKNDASNQETYQDFLNILDLAFSNSIKCLKKNRFAIVVIGDIREKNQGYYDILSDIKRIFIKNNLLLWNEFILSERIGTAAMMANRYFRNRKHVKIHQNIFVFYKGDPHKIKDEFKEIDERYNNIKDNEN